MIPQSNTNVDVQRHSRFYCTACIPSMETDVALVLLDFILSFLAALKRTTGCVFSARQGLVKVQCVRCSSMLFERPLITLEGGWASGVYPVTCVTQYSIYVL